MALQFATSRLNPYLPIQLRMHASSPELIFVLARNFFFQPVRKYFFFFFLNVFLFSLNEYSHKTHNISDDDDDDDDDNNNNDNNNNELILKYLCNILYSCCWRWIHWPRYYISKHCGTIQSSSRGPTIGFGSIGVL